MKASQIRNCANEKITSEYIRRVIGIERNVKPPRRMLKDQVVVPPPQISPPLPASEIPATIQSEPAAEIKLSALESPITEQEQPVPEETKQVKQVKQEEQVKQNNGQQPISTRRPKLTDLHATF